MHNQCQFISFHLALFFKYCLQNKTCKLASLTFYIILTLFIFFYEKKLQKDNSQSFILISIIHVIYLKGIIFSKINQNVQMK